MLQSDFAHYLHRKNIHSCMKLNVQVQLLTTFCKGLNSTNMVKHSHSRHKNT